MSINPDTADYRVMLAREIFAEDTWRVEGRRLSPAQLVDIDRIAVDTSTDTTVRDQVEDYCGEVLA